MATIDLKITQLTGATGATAGDLATIVRGGVNYKIPITNLGKSNPLYNSGYIQGVTVGTATPAGGEVLKYNATAGTYNPETDATDTNATSLQSVALSATAPTAGEFLYYSGTLGNWSATAATPAKVGLGSVTNNAQVQAIATAADNAVLRFDGTGGAVIHSSPVVISDAGKMSNVADPTLDQDAATKAYVDGAIGIAADYFFNNTASDIGGIYYNMTNQDLGGSESTLTTASLTAATDDQATFNFATLVNEPGILSLNSGIYDVHVHAERTAGNSSLAVYAEIHKRASGGAEVLIGTTETSGPVIGAKASYVLHSSIIADVDLLATDRLIVKVFANVGAGAGATLALYQEGTTTSHFSFPVSTDILSQIFLRQDGTKPLVANWDSGSYKITAETFAADKATGAPFDITSTGVSANLNADLLDGNHATAFAVTAKGVTNGDTHNHAGGDGATLTHYNLTNIGTNTHGQIDDHIASTSDPHNVTPAQVGNGTAQWNADLIQGVTMGTGSPSSGQVIKYNATTAQYNPATDATDTNATEIQSVTMGTASPSGGHIITYNATTARYNPVVPAGGGNCAQSVLEFHPINGNGTVIATGAYGPVIAGEAGTIIGWMQAAPNESCSATIDVWKGSKAIPTNTDSITKSNEAVLSGGQYAEDTDTSTDWSATGAAFVQGDCFMINVDSVSTCTKLVFKLITQAS